MKVHGTTRVETLSPHPDDTGLHDSAYLSHQRERRAHWDSVAQQMERWHGLGGTYHTRLEQVYRFLVPPGLRVVELGCGWGDMLAALKPDVGVGVDFSASMLEHARRRHPELRMVHADAHELVLHEKFDVIILSDLINDVWDVQEVLERIRLLAHPGTRVIINSYSRLWEEPLAAAENLSLAKATLRQNWLTGQDIVGLLDLAGFEVIRKWHEVLWPLPAPLLEPLLNRVLLRFWPLSELTLTNFFVARPQRSAAPRDVEPSVTVVIPVRNEAGNIPALFERIPELGAGTELVFVEGHSHDGSYEAVETCMRHYPRRHCQLLRQIGVGKGDAVRLGFDRASGDILMILDADLTVPPEALPRFYGILRSGKGEFVNGVRLVYPMEGEAMRFLNMLGNKLFSWAFSWLLGQPVKDTLCGTKALWRKDYAAIAANRDYFGDFDPFGDFDLLFGAAKLNLKIADLPVRYRRRTYGKTNIQRWKHGWLLVRMAALAAVRLKFV